MILFWNLPASTTTKKLSGDEDVGNDYGRFINGNNQDDEEGDVGLLNADGYYSSLLLFIDKGVLVRKLERTLLERLMPFGGKAKGNDGFR
ncbi:hypothetical protein Tco_0361318 [Tanacetum coccineum]